MRRTLLYSLLVVLAVTAHAERRVSHAVQASLTRAGVHRIVIEIPVGEVRVHNGPANIVSATGMVRREYDDGSRERNQQIVDDMNVVIEAAGDIAIVRRLGGEKASSWRMMKSEVSLDLNVPNGASIDFETRIGEVWLDGTFGDVDVDLRAGEVHLRTPRAAVKELNASVRMGEVHASLGDRTVDREGIFPGTTHFENPDGGVGVVNVHTTMGEVHVNLTER